MVEQKALAGSLVFAGAAQFLVFGLLVSESLYPGYSVSQNYISDLGVGPTAWIFDPSIVVLGVFIAAAGYIMLRGGAGRLFGVSVMVTGLGAAGVGVFSERFGAVHGVFSLVTFVFAGVSALASYRVLEGPLRYASVVLGIAGLLALALYVPGFYAGLGRGGMERMIVYPPLVWALGWGGYVMGRKTE
ncbi:MAG: DUF998 domain-containing protein [Nitrososphaerota archaeon]|nr:DUF998 domain-containing protein [Nitrososphaerota archaeon]MDG6939087.1 DUF998 domain-containing protein [Nitrososphaerota archaeon]